MLFVACTPDHLVLEVVDEEGSPLPTAVAHMGDDEIGANGRGHVRLKDLTGPVAMVVEAPGYLPEPVVVGASDLGQRITVALLDDADGQRTVMHFTGDVMIGRRYQEPAEGEALVPFGDGGSAGRALVADAAAWLGTADLTMVNLETVVGEARLEEAYPGKRWLLQTPPDALTALQELGVDLAILANNHQYDWLDAGVASTLDHLDGFEIPRLGAGLTEDEATEGEIIVLPNGTRVGVLAWTSVDGDFVNDAYPTDEEAQPSDVSAEDLWKWQTRNWGVPELGVEVADRRIGGAWAVIQDIESGLAPADVATLWSSAIAVYPELQDWVARRGHAGAAHWNPTTSPWAVAALRQQVDLLVVQLHMGYQFASVPGSGTRSAARSAIDAGADLVVAHHPHVLQGVEWYADHLIAYSLGNFVFDQDFLSTFRSAFLRTVWENGALVEARIVPMFLDAYRPVPAADGLADGTLRALWEGSLVPATADRGSDLGVRAVVDDDLDPSVGFRLDRHTAVIERELPPEESLEVSVPCDGGTVELPRDVLVHTPIEGMSGLLAGREVDLLGRFEDQDADDITNETVGWTWDSSHILLEGGDFGRDRALSFFSDNDHADRVSARMVARVPLPAHRSWWDAEGSEPADGSASYSVRLIANREGADAEMNVRLALYHFDDLNPTEDPESIVLDEIELPVTLRDGKREIFVDVPASAFEPIDGVQPNAVLPYLSLSPPEVFETKVWVWDFSIVEWREADRGQGYAAIDWLRGTGECGSLVVRTISM